jgi:hypothetical protein
MNLLKIVSDMRARHAAKRVGLVARKSTGFMLVDPGTDCPQAGLRFELTAADVLALCGKRSEALAKRNGAFGERR